MDDGNGCEAAERGTVRLVARFVVPGVPFPKERPRGKVVPRRYQPGVLPRESAFTAQVYTPKASKDAERVVGQVFRFRYPRYTDAVKVEAYVLWLRFAVPDWRRRDIDNLAKTILDGLNGVAFPDDSQVVEVRSVKFVDKENPRTEVLVFRAGPLKDYRPPDWRQELEGHVG